MGSQTTMKMNGDVEIDLDKLVFLDSKTNRRFKISFRDAGGCEGSGIVMDYQEVNEPEPTTQTSQRAADDAKELASRLRSLGI
jgi:hypothetical protein